VDAEEKKLSPNPEAGSYADTRADFRLHYFPDIPVDDPENVRVCEPLEEKFQRIRYHDGVADCSDHSADYDSRSTRPNGKSSGAGKFDVQAYQKGFNDGLEKGTSQGEKAGFDKGVRTITASIDELGAVIEKLSDQQQHVLKSAEQFVIDFSFAIVKKIVGHTTFEQLPLSEDCLRQVTESALNEFSESSKYIIRVHKGMADKLHEYREELKQQFNKDITVIVQDDPSLKPGDCLIETDYGVLDARIESQLSELKDIFTGV